MEFFKEIPFNPELIEELIMQCKWENIADYLKEHFSVERTENGQPRRFLYSEKILDELHNLLRVPLKVSVWDESMILMHQESVKALRNYAISEEVQEHICNERFFDTLCKLTDLFTSKSREWTKLSFRFMLQLIINMLTNAKLVKQVHRMFFKKTYDCYFNENIPLYELSALLYNLIKDEPLTDEKLIIKTVELYKTNHTNEYLQFIMDKIMKEQYFWKNYETFDLNTRLIILQDLRESELQKDSNIHKDGLQMISDMFRKSPNIIFQVSAGVNTEHMLVEASKIVEVISTLSSNDEYLKHFQNSKDILITAGVLLINIHRLGKESENCFTPVQKISELQNPNDDIKLHPAFGFKADLVQLIGNVCWKNKTMQDLARTAELIPVLLDSCNIDARNPFIIQWAILAIRNLCDNNVENQKVIASLHQTGAVSSEVLEEFGLTLHTEGDQTVKIVPFDSLRKS